MNAEKHAKSFSDQIARVAQGTASEHDKHNSFYDEYLAVMDMTAEFYLSTVDRILKKRDSPKQIYDYGKTRRHRYNFKCCHNDYRGWQR